MYERMYVCVYVLECSIMKKTVREREKKEKEIEIKRESKEQELD